MDIPGLPTWSIINTQIQPKCSNKNAVSIQLKKIIQLEKNGLKVSLLDLKLSSLSHGLIILQDFYTFLVHSIATLENKELQ